MSKKVNALFLRFKVIYGYKWTSVLSDPVILEVAKREWATVIDRMDEEDICYAVEECKHIHDWPPSIAEFIKLALRIEEEDIKHQLFPRGTGLLTYPQVERKLERERARALSQLIEERLNPLKPLLEGGDGIIKKL